MARTYELWESLLAARKAGLPPPPIDPNDPGLGFYRSRRKGQPYVPVTIWEESDELVCQMDGQDIDPQKVIDSWPFISKGPVSHEEYTFYMENGRWEDADEVVHGQMSSNPRERIGDNNPPDELTLMKEQIESASAGVAAYAEITDDVTQAKAQSLRSRLLELSKEADKKKDDEAGPHYKKYKEAHAKWKPLIDSAKAGADTIRSEMSKFETAKATKAREEQAEIARKAKEVAAAEEKAGKPVAIVHVPPPIAPAVPIKGAYGRAASSRPVKVVKKITDIDQLFGYFKTYPEVSDCLLGLAKRYAKSYPDTIVPGVEVAEEMDVR